MKDNNPPGSRRPMQRQRPGDSRKRAQDELPAIRRYLSNECSPGMVITKTMLTHLFDLVEREAASAIEQLIREGMLFRGEGGAPTIPTPPTCAPPEETA